MSETPSAESDALRAAKAESWDAAVQAVAWCLDNGESSAFAALAYVAKNNPHRVTPPAVGREARP